MADDQRESQDQAELEQNPEQQPQKWTRSNAKGCLIIIGVLAALIALIGVCNAFCGTEQPVQNEQGRPTQQPPTATSSCPTNVEAAYFDERSEAVEGFIAAGARFQELSMEAAANGLIIYDDEWRYQMSVTLGKFYDFRDQVEAMDPPPSLQPIHEDMMQMRKKAGHFAANVAYALDFEDWSYLDLAGDDFEMAYHFSNTAQAKAAAYCR